MKLSLLPALLFLLFSTIAPAQTSGPEPGLGPDWTTLSLGDKQVFLTGYEMGLAVGVPDMETLRSLYPVKLPPEELIRRIDRFYKDPANRKYPIPGAIKYVTETSAQ